MNIAYSNSLIEGLQGGAIGSAESSSYMARALYLGRNWDIEGQPFEDPVTRESLFFIGRGQADNPRWSSIHNGFTSDVARTVVNLSAGYEFENLFDVEYRL